MGKLVQNVDAAIELVESSLPSGETHRSEQTHIRNELGGNEQLHRKLVVLEQYLAKRFPLSEAMLSAQNQQLDLSKVVSPLIDILKADFSNHPQASERARGGKAQEAACSCLGMIKYDKDTILATQALEELEIVANNSNSELVQDAAKVAINLIKKQITEA